MGKESSPGRWGLRVPGSLHGSHTLTSRRAEEWQRLDRGR